ARKSACASTRTAPFSACAVTRTWLSAAFAGALAAKTKASEMPTSVTGADFPTFKLGDEGDAPFIYVREVSAVIGQHVELLRLRTQEHDLEALADNWHSCIWIAPDPLAHPAE